MAVTPEFISDVSEALDELGWAVENEQDVIDDVSQLNDDVTLPGIRVDSGTMTGYVSMKLAVLYAYLQGRFSAIQAIWDAWYGTSASSEGSVQKDWADLRSDILTKTSDANAAAQNANTKAALADSMATEASYVNANISGMTVTITNRNNVSTSVNIGFEIYRTYSSVSAMNADAANVLQGKFVMIATDDPTSVENARLYARNSNPATSENPFTFLSDLDQASSAAWADWLDNMKPLIQAALTTASNDHTQATADHSTAVSDHNTASSDHTQATTDHTTASSDHTQAAADHTTASADHVIAGQDHTQALTDTTQAGNDHTRAEGDHTTASTDHTIATGDHTQAGIDHTASVNATTAANTQANRAQGYNDHPWTIGNDGYIYVWDETTQQMVQTNKMIIDFDDLTDEQIDYMITEFYENLTFATIAESISVANELN